MCLLVFGYQHNPHYRFVAAANRDEFLERPTVPLDYLEENREIVCGRDLRAGGTWLAVASGQRFGALTNYRDPSLKKSTTSSRGDIILKYLSGTLSAEEYLYRLQKKAWQYNKFNLVLLDVRGAFYYSNVSNTIRSLRPGIYGLSNHLLDTPWPKIERAKKLLGPLMMSTNLLVPLDIFSTLQDSWRPPDSQLPDTGVGLVLERYLSSMFIGASNYGYGTRSSSLVTMNRDGDTTIYEQTYRHQGDRVTNDTIRQVTLPGTMN